MRISTSNYLALKGLVTLQKQARGTDPGEKKDFFLNSVASSETKSAPFKIESAEIDSTADNSRRAQSTLGLGNRSGGISNISTDLNVYELYPGLASQESSLASYSATDQPTTSELRHLRASIEDVTNNFLRDNPTASVSDVEAELDDHFGSGFSDIIKISITDLGSGRSEIKIQQSNFNDLDNSEKEIFNRAVSLAQDNFQTSTFSRELKGLDISSKLSSLELNLGINSKPFVDDLRSKLTNSSIDEELSSFKAKISDLFDLSANQSAQLEDTISSLEKLDQSNIDSFDTNPFAEDLTISYTSGRYARAYSSDDTETVGLLTATEY